MKESMWAAQISKPGPTSAIRVDKVPLPKRGRGQVLLEFAASAVNHVDTFVRSGSCETPVPLPFTIGRDLVSTVVEADAGSHFSPGQLAWTNSMGYAGRQGAFSEHVCVPEERLYALPQGGPP